MNGTQSRFETKNANPGDLTRIVEDLGRAFNEFKSSNDERIRKVEKGAATGDLDVKLANIDKAMTELDDVKASIDDLVKKSARGGLGGNGQSAEQAEHKQAFGRFMRKGVDDGLAELEAKALNLGSDPDGGFAVPEELDRNIIQFERDSTPMRDLCNVITVGNEEYQRLINTGKASSGWVGETDARAATGTPQLARVAPFFGEVYANPEATQKMLDDVFFDAEAWLASEVAIEFGEQENDAFTVGDGVKKPKGFLAYAIAATGDATRPIGTLQYVLSGAAATITPDALLDLIYSLKTGYRKNASFVMNSLTLPVIRKLKDGEGNYLWKPGLDAGEPSTLLQKPVVENDDMPVVAAGSLPIGFGDFKRGYTIADVRGVRVLRDPYSNKPFIGFYTTKRVGGGVMDSKAIKLMKIAAA
ncbi:phage major capsid protein [Chromobacterium sp. S0633]|uniref:phage major capsid protein n=1 Tax=Chromobacterium sp. S0633 TaxID=2957805 RepID=UPI00209D13D6|nr:phage major capsid protein [Chromobacterium sp. S0633]MCP1289829.1 phage major capsid protein [Chromobacterium sp. S0633]